MPVIVVTRLRLKDPAFFDEFFASAVTVVEQAQSSGGNLGADLPDWQDGYGRLVAGGQGPSLTNATKAHHTRDFPLLSCPPSC